MKTLARVMFLWVALPVGALGQCTLQTISYDSSVTGSGNALNVFSYPKFDGSLGTLISVEVTSVVSMQYQFQLENAESTPIHNYRVRVVREDEVSGTGLMTPLTGAVTRTYGMFQLNAYDGIRGSGSDYIAQGPLPVRNRDTIRRTMFNTADFLGSGNATFDYNSTTYSVVYGSVNNYFNSAATDTIVFRLTYTYCQSLILAADITSFTAKKQSDNILIRWTATGEQPGTTYELQHSNDGKNFHTVSSFQRRTASGDENFQYSFRDGKAGKQIFRIRQVEKSGDVKFSPLRVVDLAGMEDNRPRIYPNPSQGEANILFDPKNRGDWQVDVISISGQLVRRYYFTQSLTGRINTAGDIPKGIYHLKAVSRLNGEQFVLKLVLQ